MPDTPVEPSGSGRYPADMESRVVFLEQIARTIASSLDWIERRLDGMAGHFTGLGGRFGGIDRRFEALVSEHRADFRWLPGAMLGGFGAMLRVMEGGFHWL